MLLTSDQIIQISGVLGPVIIDFAKSWKERFGQDAWPTQAVLDAHISSKADSLAANIAEWEAKNPR